MCMRLEAMYHVNKVEFTPAEFFLETDEGTTRVPLERVPVRLEGRFAENPIDLFRSQNTELPQWSIGFQGCILEIGAEARTDAPRRAVPGPPAGFS